MFYNIGPFELIIIFIPLAIWAAFARLVGRAAASRGRDYWQWTLFAFFLSPLIAAIFLMAFGSVQKPSELTMSVPADSPLRQIELEREKLRRSRN